MTAEPPTLTQQIAAVETAAQHYLALAEKSVERGDELEAVSAELEAAAETLKTLDFGRETLR
jgi:hypothetical protein